MDCHAINIPRLRRCGYQSSQHLSAGGLDALAVDPIAIVGQQRVDHARDVVGLAHAAQRDVRLHHLLELRIVADEAAAEIRFRRARRHDVDADFARAEFLGHVFGETFHGGFQRRVNRVARQHEPARAGGDVDDVPAIVDERQQRLREKKDGLEMDVGHLVELRLGGFGERLREADAGVVDEEIKFRRAEFFERGLGDGGEVQVGLARGDVQLHRHGARAERFNLFHDVASLGLRGFVGDDGINARLGEAQRDGPADATRTSGDDGDFVAHKNLGAICLILAAEIPTGISLALLQMPIPSSWIVLTGTLFLSKNATF